MKCEIFYFSGTGNSLHIARELQNRINGSELIPIVANLNKKRIEATCEKVGFVFPVYTNTVPYQVRKFIEKIDLTRVKYIFSVVTHGGVVNPALTRIFIQKALKKKGKELALFRDVKMIINSPTGIMPSFLPVNRDWAKTIDKRSILRMEEGLVDEIESIVKAITMNEVDKGKEKFRNRLQESVFSKISGGTGREIKFLTDSTCTSCGICEKVCLSGKIKLKDGKPLWQKDINCFYCYACFNFCPSQSILVESWKHKDGRYHHPKIDVKDIASQKGVG